MKSLVQLAFLKLNLFFGRFRVLPENPITDNRSVTTYAPICTNITTDLEKKCSDRKITKHVAGNGKSKD